MEFRIGIKINFDLLQNSIALSFKRKVKGKMRVRKKGNNGIIISNQTRQHINGIQD